MDIAVTSSATISTPTIEVAMVIDNSSSMKTHLKQLQKALTSVVDTLVPDGTDPDVTFAVIPYSTYVNIGLSNKNKSWLSFAEADEIEVGRLRRFQGLPSRSRRHGRHGNSGSVRSYMQSHRNAAPHLGRRYNRRVDR